MAEESIQKLRIEVKVDWDKKQIDVVNADLKKTTDIISEAGKETQKTSINWKELARAFGLGAIAGMSAYQALEMFVGILREGIKQAIENEIVLSKLSFRLSTLGKENIPQVTNTLNNWANELSKITIFTQTETLQALDTLIKYTGDIQSAQKLLIVSTKLATAEHKSLSEVVQELGSAIAMPEFGLRRLRREYGSLVGDAKNVTEALENISSNLSKQELTLNTTAQQVKRLRKFWEEEIVERAGRFWLGILAEIIKLLQGIGDAFEYVWKKAEYFWQKTIGAMVVGLKHGTKIAQEYQKEIDKIYSKQNEKRIQELKNYEKEFEKTQIKVKKDEEKYIEERRKIEEKLTEYLNKKKSEDLNYALKLLDEEVERYRKQKINQQLIDEYYALRRKEILDKIQEEEKKRQEAQILEQERINKELEKQFLENWEKIRETWGSVIDDIVSSMKEGLIEMIDTGNITAESFEQIWERIKKSFINALTSMVAEYTAKMAVIGGISLITGMPMGMVAKGLGWGGKGLLGILGLQEGGIVTKPTLAVIGEKGPEAVIPLEKTKNLSSTTINLQVNAFDLRSISRQQLESFIRQLKPILVEELKR